MCECLNRCLDSMCVRESLPFKATQRDTLGGKVDGRWADRRIELGAAVHLSSAHPVCWAVVLSVCLFALESSLRCGGLKATTID